jgi:glycine/D-amino acid oxidase-like deaminating enzyme
MLNYEHLSFWEKRTYTEEIDTLIIGAGIVGMTCAIHEKKRHPHRKIVIVERGYLPTGASTKNAGFACFGSPSELQEDLQKMPENQVWETLTMRYEGLQKLFEIIPKEKMDYDACGSWDLMQEPLETDFIAYLNHEVDRITGISKVYSDDSAKIQISNFQGFNIAYKNKIEGSIDTGKLIEILLHKCVEMGVLFLFGTEVTSLSYDSTEKTVNTVHGILKPHQIALCTNAFAQQLMPLDVQPARAQVLVTSPINNLGIEGTFHFDAGYYYFRNVGNRILFGGGRNQAFQEESTDSMETTERLQDHLETLLRTNILPNKVFKIEYRWAGVLGVGGSKQPIVQQISPGVVAGVRMGGMGVAIGTLVGEKLSKLLQ